MRPNARLVARSDTKRSARLNCKGRPSRLSLGSSILDEARRLVPFRRDRDRCRGHGFKPLERTQVHQVRCLFGSARPFWFKLEQAGLFCRDLLLASSTCRILPMVT
jgi:hypothetical protein